MEQVAMLRKYLSYKDSGVEWLGDVPEHWELLRFKSVMKNVVEQTSEAYSDDPYIALENVESWTGRLKNLNNEIVFDSTVKRFQKGDVLFGKLRPYLAKVTQPDSNGVCVGEFFVLRPYNAGINVSFMERLLRSKPIIDAINNTTYGAKMPRANWHFVGGMIVCIPPLPEQVAIVRYLDYMDHRIRRFINAKKKLIALLEEEKQAIIHNAVTRGLDPTVRLKPSGVEWLGDVPEHWIITRLGWISDLIVPMRDKPPVFNGNIPWIRIEDFNGKYISKSKSGQNISQEIVDEMNLKIYPVGTVLCSCSCNMGSTAIVAEPLISNQTFIGIVPKTKLKSIFAYYLMGAFSPWLQLMGSGAIQQYLSRDEFSHLKLALPPLQEQNAIINYLDKATERIDSIINRTQHEITLLQEYRTRLIADVVTGKLDVREAAARLPEESGESDTSGLFGELDSMIDDETSFEEMESECESDEAEA